MRYGLPDRVFVYGTLRFGEINHRLLATATHLGTCTTRAAFTLLDAGPFPAAIDAGRTALVGDVFTVDAATFADLDILEGYPVDYTRRPIATAYGDAWIYLWIAARDPRWRVVAHGDWCRRHDDKRHSFDEPPP